MTVNFAMIATGRIADNQLAPPSPRRKGPGSGASSRGTEGGPPISPPGTAPHPPRPLTTTSTSSSRTPSSTR